MISEKDLDAQIKNLVKFIEAVRDEPRTPGTIMSMIDVFLARNGYKEISTDKAGDAFNTLWAIFGISHWHDGPNGTACYTDGKYKDRVMDSFETLRAYLQQNKDKEEDTTPLLSEIVDIDQEGSTEFGYR